MYPIIDTHCHVYPDKIAQKAAVSISRFYDSIPASFDGTLSVLREQARLAGITHSIVNSVATTPHQVSAINHYIAGLVRDSGGTMSGLGTLHPDSDDPARDVQELIDLGLKGVKLHPDIQGFALDEPRAMRLFELCQERLPLLLHLGDKRYHYSNPAQVKAVLAAFPRLRLVGAHFAGWSIWEEAADALHGYAQITVDCSSSMYALTPEQTVRLIRLYGADRVFFGSDYPLMSPSVEVDRFNALALTDEEREKIAYRNAAAYYGISL